jgi:hypothetical protein
MCANVPFIDKIVDFDKLQEFPGEFYISAYNIYRREMENWGKKEIDKDRFLAAFSFPLIYAPWEVDGEPYYEGASIDCLNFAFLVNDNETEGKPLGRHTEIDTLVVFDMLGHDRLIRKPRDLYDAWVKQIIVPLVEIARDDMKIFDNIYNVKVDQDGRPVFGPDGKPEKNQSRPGWATRVRARWQTREEAFTAASGIRHPRRLLARDPRLVELELTPLVQDR